MERVPLFQLAPPSPRVTRMRKALRERDQGAVALLAIERVVLFLDIICEARPRYAHVHGRHRCDHFDVAPLCDHAGCVVLRQLQAAAVVLRDELRAAMARPAEALAALEESEAAFTRLVEEFRRTQAEILPGDQRPAAKARGAA